MTSPTHIFFAEFCLTIASISGSPDLNSHTAIATAAGSLLPDIDISSSWTGRLFPFLSKPIEHKFGHRTITHSLLAVSCLSLIAYAFSLLFPASFLRSPLSVLLSAFAIGYASHIIIDCTTVQGVKILYPFSMRNAVFPLDTMSPFDYRIKVGSSGDLTLGFIFLLLTIPLAFVSLKTYKTTVREIQRDVASAVRQYNELAKDYIVFARIDQGINTTTHQEIKGDFMIIAAEKQNMLVVRTPDGALSIGMDMFSNDIFTDDVLAMPRVKSTTTIQSLEAQNQSLSTIRSPFQTADSLVFISGDIEFYEPVALSETSELPLFSTKFKTIIQSNNRVKLDLEPYDILESMNITNEIIKTARMTIKAITPLASTQPQNTMPISVISSSPNGSLREKFQLVEIKQSENLHLLIDTGSTITAGQAIGFIQTIDVQRLKLETEQLNTDNELLDRQVQKENYSFNADSTLIASQLISLDEQIQFQKNLVSRQLAGTATLKNFSEKLNELRTKQSKLIINHEHNLERINTAKQKTLNRIAQLNLKVQDLEQKHTITSTNQGTVKEIRSFTNGSKKQFLIVCQP